MAGLRCGRAAILNHADCLSFGPLPPMESPERWGEMRERFWSRLTGESPPERPWRASEQHLLGGLDRLLAAAEVTLWLGSQLADQLFSIWFVALAKIVGFDLGRVRVVDLGRGPSADLEVHSFGGLTPERIAAHPPGLPLSVPAIEEMRAAWAAVTADSPAPLLALLADGSPERPELHRALRCLPARFPDARTGLTRWEEALLSSVQAAGPQFGPIMQDLHDRTTDPDQPYLCGLIGYLHRLAAPRSQFPVVTVAPQTRLGHPYVIHVAPDGAEIIDPPFAAEVTITALGENILAGHRNMVELNGIDDWVAGIHLDSAASRVWYRSGDSVLI